MFKWVRSLLCTDTPEKFITSSMFVDSTKVYLEDFVDQIYDTKKFEKWFNFFPIVWLKFDKEHFDVGCTGTIRFTIPPFYYKLTVTKVKDKKCFELVSSGGMVRGIACIRFNEENGRFVLDHPLHLHGINMLVHTYYSVFLASGHVPFMNWRYKFLKKNLIKEVKRREGKCKNEA